MPDQLFFDIVKMVAALACIVGLLYAAVWLMKKLAPGAVRPPGQRVDLTVLGQLHVGSRQRVAVIRVAGRTLVVGITEGSINTLAELDLPTAAEAKKEADDPKIFAELLTWPKPGPDAAGSPEAAPKAPAPRDREPVEDDGPRLFAPGERPAR